MLLGCIADDFTGATDLANNLVRSGMRVVQTIGVPAVAFGGPDDAGVDAVVVALKSRTIAPADAVAQSLAALQWLRAGGASQCYFKICSTFDSTDRGNIGPVAEAIMQALGCDFAIACPAFPLNQRTVFNGYLFVGEVPLDESGMRDHPLTPMTDANLVRVLQRQSASKVGLIDHRAVGRGAPAIRARMAELRTQGVRLAIVDAITDDDLMAMGRAFADLPLLVAGSGVAIGLAQNHGIVAGAHPLAWPSAELPAAIVSGSCSVASNAQVRHFLDHGGEGFAVDPLALARGDDVAGAAAAWARARGIGVRPLLVYATAEAEAVRAVQSKLGVAAAGELVERALATIARGLVELGVRRLVVAGGETSGACIQALAIDRLRIGAQIDPGVPWCEAVAPAAGGERLHVALKSGNFGSVDFFSKAFTGASDPR